MIAKKQKYLTTQQEIKQGDFIAALGNSGLKQGANKTNLDHLHLWLNSGTASGEDSKKHNNPLSLLTHEDSEFKVDIIRPNKFVKYYTNVLSDIPIQVRIDAIKGKDLNSVTLFIDGIAVKDVPTFNYGGLVEQNNVRTNIKSINSNTSSYSQLKEIGFSQYF